MSSISSNSSSSTLVPPRRSRSVWLLGIIVVTIGLRTTLIDQLPSFDVLMAESVALATNAAMMNLSTSTATSIFSTTTTGSFTTGMVVPSGVDGYADAITTTTATTTSTSATTTHDSDTRGRLSLHDLIFGNATESKAQQRRKRGYQWDETLQTYRPPCPRATQYVGEPKLFQTPVSHTTTTTIEGRSASRIPKVIHQSGTSACMSMGFVPIVESWRNMTDFEYYFHTKDHMDALLHQEWPEFPQLNDVIKSCITHFHPGYVDLWKALVLWEFGGAVIEFDWAPQPNFGQLIQPNDQAIFFNRYRRGIYNTAFFLERRHPVAYYLVMHIVSGWNTHTNLINVNWDQVSGGEALSQAILFFTMVDKGIRQYGRYMPPTPRGYDNIEYEGRYNKTVRFVDVGEYMRGRNLKRNWRDRAYPPLEHPEKWNISCPRAQLNYRMQFVPALSMNNITSD